MSMQAVTFGFIIIGLVQDHTLDSDDDMFFATTAE